MENINKSPVLNILILMVLLRHVSAPHLPKYPLGTAILCSCRVAAPFGHLSVLKPRGQSSCASLPAAPYPLWGSCAMLWLLHPSYVCFPSAAQLSHSEATTGTGKRHLIAGAEAENSMWGAGRAKSGLFP